jgi:hypothetical protein
MEKFKFSQYQASQKWRFEWYLSIPYELWTARCPRTHREIRGITPPTEEQRYYADFEMCKPRKLKTRIWIEEPLDISDIQPEDKIYKHVQSDNFKTWWINVPVKLRINNGDDSYCKKEYSGSFSEAMQAAKDDVELLLLCTSYCELIDVAYDLLNFEHDN